jgi:branched-chain amino acid transport system substrate-binding protein
VLLSSVWSLVIRLTLLKREDHTAMPRSPKVTVGFLNDLGGFFEGENPLLRVFCDGYTLAWEEAFEDGLIDRPVELIVKSVEGLPTGTVHEVVQGWKELANEGCVAIIGPLSSENVVDLREYNEREGHVPTIGWSGTDRQYGHWMFGVGNGSLSEEPYLMANFLAHQDVRRVSVLYEDSAIGHGYLSFFRDACKYEGMRISHEEPISQVQQDLHQSVETLRDDGAEAIAYLGLGSPAVFVNEVLAEIGWDPLRVMTAAFLLAAFLPQGMSALKGWCGVDQYDESNLIGQDMIDRFEKRFSYRPANCVPQVAYDVANIIAHAIARSQPISPLGLRDGLERVKYLPAATGGAGTLLSFAPFVRRAWMGSNYLVIRKLTTDAKPTIFEDFQTELVHRYTARTRSQRRATLS